ncbi:MAG TPA: trypsin-like peptidase domain-containing protein [bacterium]|nr:trypsin-like peptidase domain-containing protein [bacterium]
MSPFFGFPIRVLALAAAVATAALALPGPVAAEDEIFERRVERTTALGDMRTGGEELFRQIVPSVIQVFTGSSAGSGYTIDKGGYAITNRHVSGPAIAGGHFEISFYADYKDHKRYKAELIGTDPALDFALLKVHAPDDMLVPIKLADTDKMKVGDTVATCGSPGGQAGIVNVYETRDGWLDYFNFNMGLLTEIIPMDRCLIVFGDLFQHETFADIDQLDYGTAVQYLFHVDAAINHGNSGGPCVNARGEAIGTNTWGFGGENQGMTVPVNLVGRSAREILQYGRVRRAWLGIALHDPHVSKREEDAANRGLAKLAYVPLDPEPEELKIYKINKYSPAAQFLKPGDVILAIDGKQYTNIFEVYKYILNKQVGDKITVFVRRGGIGLPPMTIELAEKQNRFTSTHIYAVGGPGGVGTAAGSHGAGVVGVTY